MKGLLVSLWLTGAVVYSLCTLFFAHAVLFGNREDPKPVTELNTPSFLPRVAIRLDSATDESAQSELQPTTPAAAKSPHAILPDEFPSELSEVTPYPSSVPLIGQSQPATAAIDDGEMLNVTSAASIRSGPSMSDEVIGTAHAGAQVKVISRDAGWVQFVDPASGRGGWIYSGLLAPFTPESAASVEMPSAKPYIQVSSPNQRGKNQAKSKNVQLPLDEEFTPRRRLGGGILGKRRMMRDAQLAPWDEDLPRRYRRR